MADKEEQRITAIVSGAAFGISLCSLGLLYKYYNKLEQDTVKGLLFILMIVFFVSMGVLIVTAIRMDPNENKP
jgi:hypothetical protein